MRGEALAETGGVRREGVVNLLLFGVLVLILPLLLASSPTIFNDGDVSWHIAAGNWIISHRSIPTTDPFSLTAAGQPWVATEWLPEIVFSTAFRMAGYPGLITIVAGAMIALHALIFFHLQRRAGPIAIAATLLILDVVLMRFLLARPHVLAWPLLAAWTILLLEAAEEERTPPLLAVLILPLWSNVHASFPLAALIGAAIAFDALQKTRWSNWRQWTGFAAASLVAILLNANGVRGLLRPLEMLQLKMLPLVQEWQPTTFAWTPQFYAALGIGLFALLHKGVRVPMGRLLLMIALGALAFSQARHQTWFIIAAACIVPPLLGSAPGRNPVASWAALAAVPLLAVRAIWPMEPSENSSNPRHLIAAIPPALRGQPLFNYYSFGGPLILAGIRPYIDGRGDMYGDAFVINYSEIMDGDAARFNAAVRRYGIRWTMLPTRSKLARKLNSSPQWTRIYADRVGAIHVRRDWPGSTAPGR